MLERGDKRKPALFRSIQQNAAFPAPTYVLVSKRGTGAERERQSREREGDAAYAEITYSAMHEV